VSHLNEQIGACSSCILIAAVASTTKGLRVCALRASLCAIQFKGNCGLRSGLPARRQPVQYRPQLSLPSRVCMRSEQ
jgi:hypothetical protein